MYSGLRWLGRYGDAGQSEAAVIPAGWRFRGEEEALEGLEGTENIGAYPVFLEKMSFR